MSFCNDLYIHILDGHVENKEIASPHAKSWDSAIRIIKGKAIDDVADECLNNR